MLVHVRNGWSLCAVTLPWQRLGSHFTQVVSRQAQRVREAELHHFKVSITKSQEIFFFLNFLYFISLLSNWSFIVLSWNLSPLATSVSVCGNNSWYSATALSQIFVSSVGAPVSTGFVSICAVKWFGTHPINIPKVFNLWLSMPMESWKTLSVCLICWRMWLPLSQYFSPGGTLLFVCLWSRGHSRLNN